VDADPSLRQAVGERAYRHALASEGTERLWRDLVSATAEVVSRVPGPPRRATAIS
jgi:hypothetical protein